MTPEPRSGVEEWIHHTQTLTADTDGYIFFLFKICFVKNSPERVTKYQWLEVDSDYDMCEHQLKVDVAVFDMMLYDEPNMAMWVHAFVMCVRYRKQRQCALAMMSKPGGI